MRVRAKFVLRPDATSAGLYVDNVLLTDTVVANRFACPDDPGLDCLDVTLPVVESGHVFAILLREEPSGFTTAIRVPASAPVGARYHPLLAPGLLSVIVAAAVLALRWRR